MSQKMYIDRPPRIEPELPSGTFDIPNPPDMELNAGSIMQQAFLPMMMILGSIALPALATFVKGVAVAFVPAYNFNTAGCVRNLVFWVSTAKAGASVPPSRAANAKKVTGKCLFFIENLRQANL